MYNVIYANEPIILQELTAGNQNQLLRIIHSDIDSNNFAALEIRQSMRYFRVIYIHVSIG